jgi:hypothetical protein
MLERRRIHVRDSSESSGGTLTYTHVDHDVCVRVSNTLATH